MDNAEAESYRLKGLLMHMEQVAGSIRSQGGEEKERLRQEHQRLYSLQASLETEKTSFQTRVTDELIIFKKKMEETNEEARKVATDKRTFSEVLSTQQRALDTDRSEFASYVMTHTQTAGKSAVV